MLSVILNVKKQKNKAPRGFSPHTVDPAEPAASLKAYLNA